MPSIHRVCVYLNLDYHSALDLSCDEFASAFKNSIIDEYQKTEAGREYLEKCKRLQETEIDITAFRKKVSQTGKGV
jgi:hypothetical protein